MKHTRLPALVALSLLLHLLAIGWIAPRIDPEPVASAPMAPIAMRLQPAQPASPATVPAASPKVPAADVTPAFAPAEAPDAAPPVRAADAPPAVAADARAATAPLPVPAPVADQNANRQMPSRYRSALPAAAILTYTMTRPGKPALPAVMRWETEGDNYTLQNEGVTGKLWAQGTVGDAGVEPKAAREAGVKGSTVATTFSNDTISIGGRDYPNSIGSQDRASLLLQLVGMGLTEPDQIRGEIAIYLAGPREPDIITFTVADDEDLATSLGTIVTRHLVQQVRTGEPRLEIWLAPARRWLPVQLRVTAPDGTAATQTITRIEDR